MALSALPSPTELPTKVLHADDIPTGNMNVIRPIVLRIVWAATMVIAM
jgi:hypothetical protein